MYTFKSASYTSFMYEQHSMSGNVELVIRRTVSSSSNSVLTIFPLNDRRTNRVTELVLGDEGDRQQKKPPPRLATLRRGLLGVP